MSVEGYAQGLVYFEAWYYVPGGYSFDICCKYVDLRAIYGHFLGSTRSGGDHISALSFICFIKYFILSAFYLYFKDFARLVHD